MAVTKTEQQERLKRNEQKWTKPLMDAGFTVLPSVIIERQKALGLDPIDVNILLHLASYWWFADNPPHPSKRTIADALGINESTVQRHIAEMEKGGLIEREKRFGSDGGQQSNFYLFDGLIKAAAPFAKESIEEREDRKEKTTERKRRKRPKRPKLHVVSKDD